MIRFFRRLSLRMKLVLFILGITLMTLLIPAVWMGLHHLSESRRELLREMTVVAEVVGTACTAPLRFQVPEDARQTLASLAEIEHIEEAKLYDMDGGLVAAYQRVHLASNAVPAQDEERIGSKTLVVTHRIIHDGEHIGTLVIASDPRAAESRLASAFWVLLLASSATCIVALVFTVVFLGMVSRPLSSLMDTSTRISETGDYSLRAQHFHDDDLGRLTDRFNQMIEQIQQRDEALVAARERLGHGLEQIRAEQWELKEARERENVLREQLSRSERMESLGLLAGGVAHDLNNILGPVVGYPDLILQDLGPDHPVRDDLLEIQKAAVSAAAVIQDLLILGRRGSYDRKPLDLSRLVRDCLHNTGFRALMEQYPNLLFQKELADDLNPIDGSAHHLSQVVMNLVGNAVEAMDGEGTLALWTRETLLTDPYEGIETIPPGTYVELCVRDTGVGISSQDLEHIFEPFYTRKKMGRSSSGLGLAVVYGVVKDLNGYLDVRSRPGEGTRFRLFFPLSQSSAPEAEETGPDVGGSEHILIVDDVAAQRNLASRILNSLGYTTRTAVSGRDGIARIRDEAFDLVLLDMIMEKDFDGLDTFRGIRELRPDQKCIIASGFSESDRVAAAQGEGAGSFVPKPYTRSKLAQAVRRELDREPATSR